MTTTTNVTEMPALSASKLLGQEVRVELARQGRSARSLATQMNRTQHWISSRISPTAKVDMTVDEIVEIAEALGVDPERLFLAVLPRLDSNQQPSGYASAQVIDLSVVRASRLERAS